MAYRSSSSLTGAAGPNAAVPVPTGAASGDIAVVGIYKENGNAVTAPDGTWTQKAALATSATARGSLYVFWKRLTAADTGTWTFTFTGSDWRSAAAALFSGRFTTGDPFDGTVGTAESTTTVSTLTVATTPAAANGDAIGFWTNFNGGNAYTPPTNYTERVDIDTICLDTRDAVAAVSTGSISATSNVSGFQKAFLGVLKLNTGGNNFTQTPTDNVGITDSVTFTLVKGITDPVGLTDNTLVGPPWRVTAADAEGLSDNTTLAFGRSQSQTDSVGLTDTVTVLGPQRFITQILGSGKQQYPADQAGNPMLVQGDVVWPFPASLGRWNGGDWQLDASTYLNKRSSQGFNLVMIGALPSIQNGASSDSTTFDGLSPWASGVKGNLNTTYWDRVEYFIDYAASVGITVLLNIAYSTDMDSASLAGATNTQYTNYGTNLGNRFKTKPNLIWGAGGDYFDGQITQLGNTFTAIQATGDTHLISIQMYPETTSRKDIFNNGNNTTGINWSDWNFVYSYNVTYDGIEYGYDETSPICVIWGDGYFYQNSTASRKVYRDQSWWALSSGARGQIHGSEGVWNWGSGSQTSVANENVGNIDLGNYWSILKSYTNWHQLAPDTDSSFLTAGRGTHAAAVASGGGGTEYTGSPQDAYVTGSVTPDGTLAVVYFPTATTVTINPAELTATYTVKWVDPTNGTETPTSIASTYTPTGNNALGTADRLLVFEGVAGTSFTQTPTDAVGLTDSVAISTTKGQTDAVGLIDSAALAQGDTEADTVGLTDSIIQVHNSALVFTDSVGVTDSASTASSSAGSVNQTDPVGLTDSPAFSQGQTKTDAVGLTDSSALTRGLGRSDAVGLTDSAQVTRALAQTDAENLTDQIALGKSAAKADVVGLSDHVTVVGGTSAARDIAIIGVTDPLSGWSASDLVVPHVITASDPQTPVWAITDPANVWALTDPVIPTVVTAGDVALPTLAVSDPQNNWALTGPDTVSWTMAEPVL